MGRVEEVKSILQQMQANDAETTARIEAGEVAVLQMRDSIDRTEILLKELKKQRDAGRALVERLKTVAGEE